MMLRHTLKVDKSEDKLPQIGSLTETIKEFPEISTKGLLTGCEKDFFCLKYPSCRSIKVRTPSPSLEYYTYAYLFFETLAFSCVHSEVITEFKQALSENKRPSTNFPYIVPFRGEDKYRNHLLRLLEEKRIDNFTDSKSVSALILLSKSVLLNYYDNDEKLFDYLNEGKRFDRNFAENLAVGFRLLITRFTVKGDKWRKQKIGKGFMFGTKRTLLQVIKGEKLLILYRKSELKASLIKSSRPSSIKEYAVKLLSDLENEKSALTNTEAKYKSTIEEKCKSWESFSTDLFGKIIDLTDLLLEHGKGLPKDKIDGLMIDLTLLSQNPMVNKDINEAFARLINRLTTYKPKPLKQKYVPVISEEEYNPKWTVTLGPCKNCNEIKEIVKHLNHCTQSICSGIDLCYKCLAKESGYCKSCGELATIEELRFLRYSEFIKGKVIVEENKAKSEIASSTANEFLEASCERPMCQNSLSKTDKVVEEISDGKKLKEAFCNPKDEEEIVRVILHETK